MIQKSNLGAKKSISLGESNGVIEIVKGRSSKVFKRFKVEQELEDLSFSI